MKGVILAGGLGHRLRPLTLVTNKHLLPVYDQPMIYYPIRCLINAGITEILVVTGGKHAGDFIKLLGSGQELAIRRLEYAYQDGEGGIAEALQLAEDFADGGKICVILGDNIIERNISEVAKTFASQASGARILLKKVEAAERFGVARFAEGTEPTSRIVEIIEKPIDPPSQYAVTGLYFYDASVFDICRGLEPSARGELEITDVNNAYLRRGDLEFDILEGWWADAGTFDSLKRASELVAAGGANHLNVQGTQDAAPGALVVDSD